MPKKYVKPTELKIERPKRIELTAKETLKRVQEFRKRKGSFIAVIRDGVDHV